MGRLVLTVTLMGCAGRASNQADAEVAVAPPRASAAVTVEASAAPAEEPCPPEPEMGRAGSRIREGTAILNASPFDLPDTLPGPGETKAPMPRLGFETARAPAGKNAGDFAVWLDGDVWHVRANGTAAKDDTLFQARVSFVSDVYAEGVQAKLTVHHHARVSAGRCWNDPPREDASAQHAGFDWLSSSGWGGIQFKASDACFRLRLRVADKQELPRVIVGSTLVTAGKLQDTLEICRALGSGS